MLEFLYNLPVLVKVLTSFALILVINKLSDNLPLALLGGIAGLALWVGHSFAAMAEITLVRVWDPDMFTLMGVIMLVIWLSSLMSLAGIMKELVVNIRSRFSRRFSMAALPAIIGLLPMPGGALFSAPLVADCDDESQVDPLLKTQINYWFRHVWEYWWPIYPGVLLALDISGIEIWQFVLIQLPMSAFAILGGYFFILRKTEKGDKSQQPSQVHILKLLTPVIIVMGVYLIIKVFFPVIDDTSKYLSMLIGLVAAIVYMQIIKPRPFSDWKQIILSKKTLILALIVFLIRIYSAFIEARTPEGPFLIDLLREEMYQFGIPVVLLIILIPFISGVTTGISVGFVGASFPVVLQLLNTGESCSIYWGVVLAFTSGFCGILLSPVHVCLIVTNEHFKTRLGSSLGQLIPPTLVVMAGGALLSLTLKLLLC